jgi:hypothetical protein
MLHVNAQVHRLPLSEFMTDEHLLPDVIFK